MKSNSAKQLEKTAGTIVREIMISHGKPSYSVFQNLYKSGTRTVKCYKNFSSQHRSNDEMIKSITKVLKSLGIPFEVRQTECHHYSGRGGSIIIKFLVDF